MYFASVFLDGVWYIYVFVLPSNVLTTNSGALCVSTSQWQTIHSLSHTLSDDCSSVVDMFLQTWLATCSPAGFVSAICLKECSTDQCKHQAVLCDSVCVDWTAITAADFSVQVLGVDQLTRCLAEMKKEKTADEIWLRDNLKLKSPRDLVCLLLLQHTDTL